ncbi:MAG: SGNH/GDSL hydrolase family protein [Candidatus Eisenbacteria bacterium]
MDETRQIRLFKLTAVLIIVLVPLVVLEIALRWRMPQLGWTQRTDACLGWSSREYRDFDPEARSKPDVTRILFLGDSFLAGAGVSDLDHRFPVVLSEMLGPHVEIAILASGAWGTDQELLAFRAKGAAWDPDIVVLAFCANNDISNILSHHHGPTMLKPYFTLDEESNLTLHDTFGARMEGGVQAADEQKTQIAAWKRFYVLRWIGLSIQPGPSDERHDLARFSGVDPQYREFLFWNEKPLEIYKTQDSLSWAPHMGINHVSAYIHEDFSRNSYQWRLFERLVVELRDDVQQGGGELVVMLLPAIFNPWDLDTVAGGPFEKKFATPDGEFTFRSAEPRDRLDAICSRNGIRFLDPTWEFRRTIAAHDLHAKVWPPPHDRHFSDVGHNVLAMTTARWFRAFLDAR